jgi:UDP-glucuronate 4-epimerase
MKKCYLITGAAGFIGSHLADKLLSQGNIVIGIDNFDDFYSKEIKLKNLRFAYQNKDFVFFEKDITNLNGLLDISLKIDAIIHLAAKAGVRPSILNPQIYQEINIKGTQNILDFANNKGIGKIVFASSSSIYGINPNFPWSEKDNDLKPISPYASTKMAGELMGHVYSHLYGISFIGLRFFTVYGPRQRPDLAIHKFAKAILQNKPIPFYGDGKTLRDYTYIDDIISGILGALDINTKFDIFNLGNTLPVSLSDLISILETVFEKKAIIEYLPMQEGDVPVTFADITKANKYFDYKPQTGLIEGIKCFKDWLVENEKNIVNK